MKFDAEAWVRLAQDAGMKYIVITSKHHDGFALFGSKASPYNVVDATPFRRDILKELAAACAKARDAARLLLLAGAGLARAERRAATTGTSGPTTGRTSTATCARRPSRRCASCSPATARSR